VCSSDLRASTPSNAIERIIPIRDELMAIISQAGDRIDFAIDRLFTRQNERISNLIIRLSAAPMRGISNARLKQTQIMNRMNSATDKMFMLQKNRITAFNSILTSTNPTRVLERGYSMAIDDDGVPVTSVVGLKSGDPLTVVLKDGRVQTEVRE
jgi:exodeoxyribonuclease VII large subunit